ncbi:NADPH-dependent FMN reductase [Dyadobacter luticola]|uniref:NAD(P)H-dependent oxidoreductase n=1 Tax=Dyadobacter luticola TaxID=1979387 RepID=A0A5R9L414_9BACT|nr:NADPH-dependent FMN reductase [Dyadobacter luticola]TLV03010.1 NAD(P)H-dependent oxidoreductase [Dyadobacter luticola]
MNSIHILGISGSLRADSTNTIILNSFQEHLPRHVTFEIFQGLGEFPHFSPELQDTEPVTRFKNAIQQASGVIICTPEYAFGVPGTLKNALDWTVGTGDLNDKPLAVISASPLNSGGDKALASILLTLTALGAKRNEHSALSIPNIKQKIRDGKVTDSETISLLKAQAENLMELISSVQG